AYFDRARETDIDAPLPGEIGPYLEASPGYERQRASLLKESNIPALQREWESGMRAAMDDPGKNLDWDFAVTSFRAMVDHGERIMRQPVSQRTPREQHSLTDYFVRNSGPVFSKQQDTAAKLKELRGKLDTLDKGFPNVTQAYAIEDDPHPPTTHIALR